MRNILGKRISRVTKPSLARHLPGVEPTRPGRSRNPSRSTVLGALPRQPTMNRPPPPVRFVTSKRRVRLTAASGDPVPGAPEPRPVTRQRRSLQTQRPDQGRWNPCPVNSCRVLPGHCLRREGEVARGWRWSTNGGRRERRCDPRRLCRPCSIGGRRRTWPRSSRCCSAPFDVSTNNAARIR
jgi:hypothetical protein